MVCVMPQPAEKHVHMKKVFAPLLPTEWAFPVGMFVGIAQMAMLIGWETGSFINVSVLRSIHDRYPQDMNENAGFIGQAIMSICGILGNLLAPAFLVFLRPKWLMIIGSLFFPLFYLSYMSGQQYFVLMASGLLGVFFQIFNEGFAIYNTQISTRDTLERINAMQWSIANASIMIGAVLYIVLSSMGTDDKVIYNYRNYSDLQIKHIFGVFAIAGVIATLLYCLIPDKCVEDSIFQDEKQEKKEGTKFDEVCESLKETLKMFGDPTVLLLVPHFVYVGLQIIAWLAVFPITLQYTTSLSHIPMLTAYYGLAFGVGELLMGYLTMPLSRKINNFGRIPCLLIAVVLQVMIYFLVIASTPGPATHTPTKNPAFLFPPNAITPLIIGFLMGLLDSCNNTNRVVMCSLAIPDKAAHVFSVARFWQAIFGAFVFSALPYMDTYRFFTMIFLLSLISSVLFYVTDQRLTRLKREAQKGSKRRLSRV